MESENRNNGYFLELINKSYLLLVFNSLIISMKGVWKYEIFVFDK